MQKSHIYPFRLMLLVGCIILPFLSTSVNADTAPDGYIYCYNTICGSGALGDYQYASINDESACHKVAPLYNTGSGDLGSIIADRKCSIYGPYQTSNGEIVLTRFEYLISCPSGQTYNSSAGIEQCSECPTGQYQDGATGNCLDIEGDTPIEKNSGRCDGNSCCLGNPITAGTGNKYQAELDIQLPPLIFRRFYNSLYTSISTGDPSQGFSYQWRHSYQRSVVPDIVNPTTEVSVHRAEGKVFTFNLSNGQWVTDADILDQLEQLQDAQSNPVGWRYTTTDNTIEDYDIDGSLTSVTGLLNNIQTLTYDAIDRLDRVDSNTGESLVFGYDTLNRIITVTDHTNRVWGYRYDAVSNLEFVDNPDGTTKQYYYEDDYFVNILTGITDERGIRYATFGYDTQGRAILSTHAGNAQRVDIVYNADGSRTVTNSRGDASTYDISVQLGVALVTNVSGPGCSTCGDADTSNDYDPANNNLMSTTDNSGVTKYGQYDAKGQYGCKVEGVTAADTSTGECAFDPVASPDARRVDYVYDSRFFNRITTMTERSINSGSDKVITTSFDAFGNRLSETMSGFSVSGTPVSRTTSYQYNGPLNQLSQIDGSRTNASDITQYRYYANDALQGNNRARLKEVEDANGNLIRSNIQYAATGKVESESRPNGLSLDYVYLPGNDRLSSLTETGDGDTRVTQWTYLATGEVASITTGVGTSSSAALTLGYDDARRLTRITDGLGNYVDYILDTEGNRLSEMTYDANGTPSNFADDVLKKQITQTFDVYNRLDTSSQANESQNLTFAPDGTLDTQVDGNSVITDYSYDALKRLTQSIQDQGGTNTQTKDATTAYGYDVADRLISVTDPIAGNTTYQYDDLGNLLSQTSPDTGTTAYLYDNAGNLTQKTDAKAQVIVYTYDAINRLTGVDATGTEDDLTYTYDSCTNGINRLCTVQSATQTVHTTYDEFGEITRSQGMSRTYVADKLDTLTYPSGAQVTYTYDLAGQVTQMDLIQNGITETIVSSIQYAPLGPIEQLTWGNGQILTQSLDSAYRSTDKSTPGILTFDTVLFDPNGNLTTRNETVGANSVIGSTYSYDPINRLQTATGAFGSQSLAYDKNGNRTQDTLNSQVTPYTYNPNSNQISTINAIPVILDANGNTEAQNSYAYTYTTHNRLKTATESASLKASFTYNGLGQRNHKINEQTTGGKYFFYGQAGELLAETDQYGNVLTEYLYLNGTLIAHYQPDSDGDGQTNAEEAKLGTNPTNTDTDSDGLTDIYELLQTGTSTQDADSDQDGSTDSEELTAGTDPLNPDSIPVTPPPSTPVAAPGLQVIALISLSILFLGIGAFLVKRGIHTPAVFFIGLGLLLLPNQYKLSNSDYLIIKSAHALPIVSGKLYFVHTDNLGTPRVMTDRSATVVWQATYDPFGKATVDEDPDGDAKLVENNVRFPGQYYDNETGLHYNYFRSYDPSTGRYLTADPIGLDGGLNTYAYVGGNPVNRADPLGLFYSPGLEHGSLGRPEGFIPGPFGPTCGPSGSPWANWIPDGRKRDACQKHDECYATCGSSKQQCDIVFYRATGSLLYFKAVDGFGRRPYEDAQRESGCDECSK